MQPRFFTTLLILALGSSSLAAEPPAQEPVELPAGVPADFPIEQFEVNPFEVLLPEEVPEHLRPRAELRGAEVPYAARAKSLLIHFGAYSETAADSSDDALRAADMALETLGLEPSSEASRELLTLAANYRQVYLKSLRQRVSLPTAESQHQMEVAAYQEAGKTFGTWLSAREAEGWAVSPLLERLLNGTFSGLSMFSTDESPEEFRKDVAEYETAFQIGLQQELGWIPRRFQ